MELFPARTLRATPHGGGAPRTHTARGTAAGPLRASSGGLLLLHSGPTSTLAAPTKADPRTQVSFWALVSETHFRGLLTSWLRTAVHVRPEPRPEKCGLGEGDLLCAAEGGSAPGR